MPYSITRCNSLITYTVTTPNWVCEWIVGNKHVQRNCHIVSKEYMDIDIIDEYDAKQLNVLFPELVSEVTMAIKEWIQAGDPHAATLLTAQNCPMYLQYAISMTK